jgi:hypothetical protein
MSASKDDEIYFHHKGMPKSGKVLCTGKHGCTVDCGGEQHKLKWEHLAGHKKRAPQRYTVVEEGEDGIIVQDASGKRRLVAIPPEARAERLELAKPKK